MTDSTFFFFNDTATTEIYTLSLHDALPISWTWSTISVRGYLSSISFWTPIMAILTMSLAVPWIGWLIAWRTPDRKSTRLNSSHANISYAVFCLKKKNQTTNAVLSGTNHISS